jgi:hypothetical protein
MGASANTAPAKAMRIKSYRTGDRLSEFVVGEFFIIAQMLPLLLSTRQRQNDLRNQIHRELVYRPFAVPVDAHGYEKRSPLRVNG